MQLMAMGLVAALSLAAAQGQEISLPVSAAKVTNDVGAQGNVSHGNLPNPGDEVGWTLPEDFAAGVYRVLVDGRTGDQGEGTSFVAGYRLGLPDGAFPKSATPHEIGLHWPGTQRPVVRAKGEGYSVFQGRMVADELVQLGPGDLVRVHGSSGWSMVWSLILRPATAEELVQAEISTEVLASIFAGDEASFPVAVTNWTDEEAEWTAEVSVRDLAGEEVDRTRAGIVVGARSREVVTVAIPRKVYGPLWARLEVRDGEEVLARDDQGFCFSPAPRVADVGDESVFGIHKSNLGEWPEIGAKWVRLWDTGDTWNRYEKERGKIEWEGLDKKVADAQANGVKVLYVFAYTPTWASARPEEPHYTGAGARAEAKDIEDWKNFVRAVVSRYRGRVDHFEVWNEPNAGFFSGSVEAYYELLKAAYGAAKEANPDCTVLGISGTGGYLGWMEEVLKLGALEYMDAVAVHTYTTPNSPEGANLLGRMETTHALIRKYGGEHPIWNTEVGIWQPERQDGEPISEEEIVARAPEETRPNWQAGWPYRPISELEAARHCVRMYVLSMASDVKHLFWYAWYQTALPMYTTDNAPRLMSVAYAGMAAKLSGARFVERITLGAGDLNVCLFEHARGPIAAAWSTRADGRTVAFKAAGPVTVTDMWGNQAESEVKLGLAPSPVYVEGLSLEELRTVGLAGERLVFEAPDAEITADVAEGNVKEHTSGPHHGDRRVMGLPDAGDEITWTLGAIEAGVYRIEIDGFIGWTNPTNHIGKHVVSVRLPDEEAARRVEMVGDPERVAAKVGDVRHYGVMISSAEHVLAPGARVSISKTDNWGFVGALTLVKVAEIERRETVVARKTDRALVLDGDLGEWPDVDGIAIAERRQAVVGVADAFASTNEHDAWKGPGDASARARVVWDGENLWLGVEVTDDKLRPATGGGAWTGDCLEVFLDLREEDEVGSAVITDDVYQTFCPAPNEEGEAGEVSGRAPEGSEFRVKKTAAGWALEGRIPVGARTGAEIGFDLALDDADNVGGERAIRKAQLVWHGTANNFEDPSAYGRLRLDE